MINNNRSSFFDYEVSEKLIQCKNKYHDLDSTKDWIIRVEDALEKFHKILSSVNFKGGGNLNSENLNEIFRLLKKSSSNRNLSRLIYENIGIESFNENLRNLYYGKQNFDKRIQDFLQIQSMGIQSTSQFLLFLDPCKFPLITKTTIKVLNIDTNMESKALEKVKTKFNIQKLDKLPKKVIKFLKNYVILEEVKDLLELKNYYTINMLLWKLSNENTDIDENSENLSIDSIPIERKKITGFNFESDLRDYLAEHTDLIESNLILEEKGKEYDTGEAGRIDLLCKDDRNYHVVIELKKYKSRDKVIGQILRYIGWVKENINENVRGIIILYEPDDKLNFALNPIKNFVKIKYYRMNFQIFDDYPED